MFERLAADLLSKYLGDFVFGLNKESLNIGIWKGDVTLENLRVKSTALDFLNLPISVGVANGSKIVHAHYGIG